ncbi:ATP-grasp domain-containing protein [Niabella sp. CJ426]|uniref:ATP-grasp domain-containing protein n=1 Tax=Niabella sp. CJ426 TaxID=3393740 RepID=UPI003D00B94F
MDVRRTKLPDFSSFEYSKESFLLKEYDSFLSNIFSILHSEKWLSHPDKIYKAENKLLQLKYAKEIGFNVPHTLISTQPDEIRDFYYSNGKQVVFKPFFNSKIEENGVVKLLFTNLIKEDDINSLEQYELTPVIYQKFIEKKLEYRVTVVEDDIFVASVNSQIHQKTVVDWRRGDLKFERANIPYRIKEMCFDLVKRFGLKFGAIDLIRDNEDNCFFVEINPNGQWVWIEMDTGLKISNSIVKYLTSHHEIY